MQETVDKYHLLDLRKHEKVLVALSGGKDSSVLLSILDKLYHDQIDLEALYLDLGIRNQNYSTLSGKIAAELCDKLQIPFHNLDVKEAYGFDIDDLHRLKTQYNVSSPELDQIRFRGTCAYCGTIKRYAMNRLPQKINLIKWPQVII